MREEPFTFGELIKIFSEFPKDHELHFIGPNGELLFSRFKTLGGGFETMELSEIEE